MLQLSNICKRFGDLVANDQISLQLARGEVLALLGENGAGKSTLMSILFGHYVADSGTVEIDGVKLAAGDTRAALAAGVGMVHQHFSLAENLSVLDNVMLGHESLWRWRSQRTDFHARLRALSDEFGLSVNPQAIVRELSVGERQRVEILKALMRGVRYLILDEPTSVLTPAEIEQLFQTLRRFIAKGLGVIFISHKLGEVLSISHRIAVLRAGKLVAEFESSKASPSSLAQAMMGEERSINSGSAAGQNTRELGPAPTGSALRVYHVSVSRQRRALLSKVDFDVRRGQVFAVAGVAGNGQQALAQLLSGELTPDRGTIELFGRPITYRPRAWIAAQVARIPEDRLALGVVADADLCENAIIDRYLDPKFCRWPGARRWLHVLNRRAMRAQARSITERFDVRFRKLDAPIRNLSGGNIQKFILGRELADAPALVIANQPTWGLDIGAVSFVHQQLRQARNAGAAIVLISEDLDEVFSLADRIAVMFQGRLVGARDAANWSREKIGLAMAGQMGA